VTNSTLEAINYYLWRSSCPDQRLRQVPESVSQQVDEEVREVAEGLPEDAALAHLVEEHPEAEALSAEAHSAEVGVLLEAVVGEVSQAVEVVAREAADSLLEVVAGAEADLLLIVSCSAWSWRLTGIPIMKMCSDGSVLARS